MTSNRYRPDVKLTVRSGFPGSGKTTRLVNECWDWPAPWQIVTYSRDAAQALHAKGVPAEVANTIYKRTWNHVQPVAEMRHSGKRSAEAYRARAINDRNDVALRDYVSAAPGRQKQDPMLMALHAWSPTDGPAPTWIYGRVTPNQRHAVGLARWLDQGAPMVHDPYPFVAYDEAQDASRLETCAALAMVAEGGELLACGDEGQAIFGGFKGYLPGEKPAAWQWADRQEYMSPGYRIGRPATEIASTVLAPHAWHDPELYSAPHPTMVHHWDMVNAPLEGLVMGLSRYTVDKYIQRHDLTAVGVVPGTRSVDGLAVTTIHAAKGHESDSIYMLPWSKQKLMALDNGDPEMLKVAYVALTRAKYHIHLPTDLYARWA